jgi:hypothetical protein
VSFEDWKNHDQKRANPGFAHHVATAVRPGIVEGLRTEQHRHRSDTGEGGSLLIDCVQWPSWYKHCRDFSMLRGGPLLSAQSKFRFKTLGFYFEPDIETFEPFKMLIWSAKGPAGTRGAHAWYIERKTGGCRVITEEAQRGLLLAFIGGRTQRTLLTSHEEWLRALKVLAEKS